MDIYEKETDLMRLIFNNTLIASHCEVESIIGAGRLYDISSGMEGTQLN